VKDNHIRANPILFENEQSQGGPTLHTKRLISCLHCPIHLQHKKTYNGKHKLEAHINKFWKFIANKQIMTQLEIAQLFLQAPGEGEPLVGSHNFQDESFDLCQFQKWG